MKDFELWTGALTAEKCEELEKIAEDTCDALEQGTIFSDRDVHNKIRNSKVGWTDAPEIKSILEYYYKEANRSKFGFDVDYMPSVQYTIYQPNNFYSWHHDINWISEKAYDRKLSIVVQLTDSSSYEGGAFQFKYIKDPEGFEQQGSILVFPSYHMHRVQPILSGTRKSLVAWVEGPKWR